MGEKISVEDLRERAEKFFAHVVDVLEERNIVRGDSYLEMDPDDFVGMFRDKAGRIKTGSRQNLSNAAVRKEIIDSVLDEAGYAALAWIWFEEKFKDVDKPTSTDSSGD